MGMKLVMSDMSLSLRCLGIAQSIPSLNREANLWEVVLASA